ncbi:MAG: TIGR00725 family protein [Gracilimonas sp.]|uniref:TIGR00725 family protein n=1 Tax=Gracilimonas sp. TaxID=1974203 RepID=UPI001999BA3E|nr:TIGR00725 family protein [Gracilimonas sp.]MBD3616681.1 TIGR00725 family protein [Gracilimonas sp.]
MDHKRIIGIMGPGEGAATSDKEVAFELGKSLAGMNCYILTGGRATGVMEAAMKGAKSAGGTTIGILPTEDGSHQSEYVDIPIKTGMGSARNNINVLTADVVVGIGIGPGTTSEIVLAMKAKKPIILLNQTNETLRFFLNFNYQSLYQTNSVKETIETIRQII